MSSSGRSWGFWRTWRPRVAAISAALGLTTLLGAPPANAQVMEPNGLSVPQPVGAAEISIATGRGMAPESLMLEGLFSCFHDDMLDPIADADTQPAAFSPLCGFTGTLVMRGGGCKLDFGWYNANQSGQRPTEAEIFTLVPAAGSVPAGSPDQDFCPLAADHVGPDPTRADVVMRVAACNSCPDNRAAGVMTFNADGIRTDPRFMGPDRGGTGLIGFAIRQPAGMSTQCPETHFSENDLNTCTGANCTNPGPWVMSLIYTSRYHADSFYVAFEDLPTANWGQGNPVNDGDFNDFIYFITGLTCEGGGQPCTVPDLVGACAAGVTACGPGGVITCSPRIQPTPELCDNIDNDCNGAVDDDPTLCVADNKVCYQGKCVPKCNTGEFQCLPGEMCNAEGLCIDMACVGVTCTEGQICRGGMCVGACDGVVCPFTENGPQECQLGRCVDLCAASTCPEGTVCERGSCVRNCECRDCPDNTACNRDEASAAFGQCVDTVCANMMCPAGQICYLGECLNPCANAVCPGGAACDNGECGPPGTAGTGGTGGTPGGGTGGVIVAGTSSGASTGLGGSSAASGGGGGDGGDDLGTTPQGDPGCACRSAGSRDASGMLALLAAAVAGALGMRRRQRA